jgi:hypothetical protein
MAETGAALRAVDRLEITILVDNTIDVFLLSTAEAGAGVDFRYK